MLHDILYSVVLEMVVVGFFLVFSLKIKDFSAVVALVAVALVLVNVSLLIYLRAATMYVDNESLLLSFSFIS